MSDEKIRRGVALEVVGPEHDRPQRKFAEVSRSRGQRPGELTPRHVDVLQRDHAVAREPRRGKDGSLQLCVLRRTQNFEIFEATRPVVRERAAEAVIAQVKLLQVGDPPPAEIHAGEVIIVQVQRSHAGPRCASVTAAIKLARELVSGEVKIEQVRELEQVLGDEVDVQV